MNKDLSMYPGQQQYGGPPHYGQPPYQPQTGSQYTQLQTQYGQQQYQQQQYPQTPQQGSFPQSQPGYFQSGPQPPPKRQKSNPVITRYAPPPGYQPPPQGRPSFGHAQFQGAQQGFNQQQGWQNVQQPSQGYQPQGLSASYQQQGSHHPQQSFQNRITHHPSQQFNSGASNYQQQPFAQNYQQPAQSFSSQQGFQQHQGQRAWQQQQQNNFPQSGSPSTFHSPQNQHSQAGYQPPAQQWQGTFQSAPNATSKSPLNGQQALQATVKQQIPVTTLSRNSTVPELGHALPPKPNLKRSASDMSIDADQGKDKVEVNVDLNDPLNLNAEEWEFDGDGALWPKTNEPVDPDLSIGILVWHPATTMTRALASTFEEAETFANKPMPKAFGNGESVSKYCTLENSHDAFLDIQSLPYWEEIRDDPIFVEFPDKYDLVPLEEVLKVRDRPETEEDEPKEEGEIGALENSTMDGLEQTSIPEPFKEPSPSENPDLEKAEANSSNHLSTNDEQEDILAKLGVTGAAKPVYPTPGPAYAVDNTDAGQTRSPTSVEPIPASSTSRSPVRGQRKSSYDDRKTNYNDRSPAYDDRRSAYDDHRPEYDNRRSGYEDRRNGYDDRKSSYGYHGQTYDDRRSVHEDRRPSYVPPPPHEPPRPQTPDVWTTNQPTNGRYSPARSDKSNRTVTGSDFGDVDNPAASTNGGARDDYADLHNRPSLSRSDTLSSRKRSYAEVSDDGNEKLRQTDDSTPKTKRRQSRVSSAYDRR